jgi:uncharacterized membrane protein YgaE (UPF0421/DUF939 family)
MTDTNETKERKCCICNKTIVKQEMYLQNYKTNKTYCFGCEDKNIAEETFESYFDTIKNKIYINYDESGIIFMKLKQLHDTEIKKYKSFIESEDLRHKFELKEKDKEIEKWKMLWQKTETERLKLQKEIDRRNEEDKLLGVL